MKLCCVYSFYTSKWHLNQKAFYQRNYGWISYFIAISDRPKSSRIIHRSESLHNKLFNQSIFEGFKLLLKSYITQKGNTCFQVKNSEVASLTYIFVFAASWYFLFLSTLLNVFIQYVLVDMNASPWILKITDAVYWMRHQKKEKWLADVSFVAECSYLRSDQKYIFHSMNTIRVLSECIRQSMSKIILLSFGVILV